MAQPKVMAFKDLAFTPRFEYGEMAQVAQVVGSDDLTELGTGFGRLTKAEIPWTIQYDEIIFVIEGELTVETRSQTLVAGPKDSIWLPKGTELVYRAENALIFYAIHPANWAEKT